VLPVAACALALAAAGPVQAGMPRALELDATQVVADAKAPAPLRLAQADDPAEPMAPRVDAEASEASDTSSSLPISLSLSYAVMSDYVFRGVNFSEYEGEGREKLNHQFDVNLEFATDDYGTFGLEAWFEWFGAQHEINPIGGGQNLQEIDYLIYWSYSIEQIATDFTIGYTWYMFPNLGPLLEEDGDPGTNNDGNTQEWWFSLEHNDAWMWKALWPDNEDGVLNPSFLFAHDIGSILGVWMELGISHEFAIPGVDNFTITPGYTLLFDCNYWTDGFKLTGDQWSLDLAYDLTPVLQLPDWAGELGVGCSLYFFNAYGNPENSGTVQDEFFGGLNIGWSWGG
jgi:hypothetical protein